METKVSETNNKLLEKTNEADKLKKLLDEKAKRILNLERTNDKLNTKYYNVLSLITLEL